MLLGGKPHAECYPATAHATPDAVLVPVITACAESPTRPAREPSDG